MPGVTFLRQVTVAAYTESRFGRVEADLDAENERIFALPLSGRHEVIVYV
jgi:hypothetical protein